MSDNHHNLKGFRLSQTYLFKVYSLKNTLDKAFDKILRTHAHTTLSQLLLLLTIMEHDKIHQRKVAQFLGVSPAAVNRQVDIALDSKLVRLLPPERGKVQALCVTKKGLGVATDGIMAIDKHLQRIFAGEDRPISFMDHLDQILCAAQDGGAAAADYGRERSKSKGDMAVSSIPKARKLYRGNINAAVVQVQKTTGVNIDPRWWERNVGNNGTSESILDRFDRAYERDFAAKIAQLAAKNNPKKQ